MGRTAAGSTMLCCAVRCCGIMCTFGHDPAFCFQWEGVAWSAFALVRFQAGAKARKGTAMEKRKITLRELKAMLPPTTGKKLPSPKHLRENAALMIRADVSGCVMEVYQSGFAVYRVPNHFSVLRMEHVGRALYESETDGWHSSVNLEDEDWVIGVMLCGEERLEQMRQISAEASLVSLTNSSPDETGADMEIDAGVDVLAEVIAADEKKQMLDCLTERQRQVVELFYFEGLLQADIAGRLGISIPVVCKRIKAAERAIRKKFKKVI